VLGGMISATVLAVLFVPVFFVVVMRLFRRKDATEGIQPAAEPGAVHVPHHAPAE
jgi:multidrug efflux pump